MTPPRVAVHPARILVSHARLIQTLEAAFDVRFSAGAVDPTAVAGALIVGADADATAAAQAAVDAGLPTLAFSDPAEAHRTADVRLHEVDELDRRIHGIVLESQTVARAPDVAPGDAVIATRGETVVWVRRMFAGSLDLVATALPSLQSAELIWRALIDRQGSRALGIVALVEFLRHIEGSAWLPAPLRAAFVFDDPNLRRSRYGYVDYERLTDHADAHNYHASMAMVPLDASAFSGAAVAMFKERADRLSLVFHGNDHVRRELMQPLESEAALALGAQALRRINRFQRRTGLSVDHVMMPPHGMCSRLFVRSFGALGYEAVCSIHPCPWTESAPADRLLAGWTPAEFVDGCAVLPRFQLAASATEIALRAYLDQPLVLYGHHDDLSSGLQPLADAAARVNRLGDVRWCSVEEIARSNARVAVAGDVLVVRPWARRVRIRPPAGITAVKVALPDVGVDSGVVAWSRVDHAGERLSLGAAMALESPGREIEILVSPGQLIDPDSVPDPPWRAWPRLRRRAAETRDRLVPAAQRGRRIGSRFRTG